MLFEYGKTDLGDVLTKLCLKMSFEECYNLLYEYVGLLNKELNSVYTATKINIVDEKLTMNFVYKLVCNEYTANLTFSIMLILYVMECTNSELKYIYDAFDFNIVYNSKANVISHLVYYNGTNTDEFKPRINTLFTIQTITDWVFTPIGPATMEYEFKVLSSCVGKQNVLDVAYAIAGKSKKLKAFLVFQELS